MYSIYTALLSGRHLMVYPRPTLLVVMKKHTQRVHFDSGSGRSSTCPNLLYFRPGVTLDSVRSLLSSHVMQLSKHQLFSAMVHLRGLLRGDARSLFVCLASYSFTLPPKSPSISRGPRLSTPHTSLAIPCSVKSTT